MTSHPDPREELDRYDSGLLNDFGGGNVSWWQDYIRAELERAHGHYQDQIDRRASPPSLLSGTDVQPSKPVFAEQVPKSASIPPAPVEEDVLEALKWDTPDLQGYGPLEDGSWGPKGTYWVPQKGTREMAIRVLAAAYRNLQARIPEMEKAYIELSNQSTRYWQERDAWIEDASLFCKNMEFYRGLVYQIGEMFGVEAKTADDGSIMQDVLALKVPGLVSALQARWAALEKGESNFLPAESTVEKAEGNGCACGHEWHDRRGCLVINCPCAPSVPEGGERK